MSGEVLNMNILTLNKHQCELKDLYFKTIPEVGFNFEINMLLIYL